MLDSTVLLNELLDLFRTGFLQGILVAMIVFFTSYGISLVPKIIKYILN